MNNQPPNLPIYFDYAATTPVDTRVVTKMMQYLSYDGAFGNPSSDHEFGKFAKEGVEKARQHVAELIHASKESIVWTSSATESINLALKGATEFYQSQGKHIITCQTEHRAVLDSCQALASLGFEITYLKPESDGILKLESLKNAIRQDTLLVSLMHVNNETGVIQDIESIGNFLRSHDVLFHVDATQSVGKIPVDVKRFAIDFLSFSAHKLYGPKGIGVLYISNEPKRRIIPQIHGGGQERGFRSGTVPTHQCVGMGEACRIAKEEMTREFQKTAALQQKFWKGICDLPEVFLNGSLSSRIPNIMNICFAGIDEEQFSQFLASLKDLAISSSAACSGNQLGTSHVLRAMGLKNELARRSLRFTLGRFTQESEIAYAIQLIREHYSQHQYQEIKS